MGMGIVRGSGNNTEKQYASISTHFLFEVFLVISKYAIVDGGDAVAFSTEVRETQMQPSC